MYWLTGYQLNKEHEELFSSKIDFDKTLENRRNLTPIPGDTLFLNKFYAKKIMIAGILSALVGFIVGKMNKQFFK